VAALESCAMYGRGGPDHVETRLEQNGLGRWHADSEGSRPRIRDDVVHHSDLMSLGVPRSFRLQFRDDVVRHFRLNSVESTFLASLS
jgi:hypothetical protein